jgi:hypothetical protein
LGVDTIRRVEETPAAVPHELTAEGNSGIATTLEEVRMIRMSSSIRIVAALGILAFMTATSATAEPGTLQAHIGFEFRAGETVLPAGIYSLSRLSTSRHVLLVRGARGGVMLTGQEAGTSRAPRDTSLVFHRYGSRYFLRQVWFDGTSGFALPETLEERTLAERTARTGPSQVNVTVAAALH